MKPGFSNDVWVYENERDESTSSEYGEIEKTRSGLRKKHFTDSEQISSSFDTYTKEQAQRAPIMENQDAVLMHPIHEFDQDSMLHFQTDDIISRISNKPSDLSFSINNNQNKQSTQDFETNQDLSSYTKKNCIDYEPNISSFGDSNGEDRTAYSHTSFDQDTIHRVYPSTPYAVQQNTKSHMTKNIEQNLSRSDQNCNTFNQKYLSSSASSQKNDAAHTISNSKKPYQECSTHKNLGSGSDDILFDSVTISADKSYNSQDHANLIAGKVLALKEEPVLKSQDTPSQNRSDFHYDSIQPANSAQIRGINGSVSVSSNKVQDTPQLENVATEKRNTMIHACDNRTTSCESYSKYVIVKVSPTKVTHKHYDVPTRGQSLLNKAIQASSGSLETLNSPISEFPSDHTPDSKYTPNNSKAIYSPYDVPTLGQTIMKESADNFSQKNGVTHSVYDVPTKAQFMLQEAVAAPSLKNTFSSSYCAITQSILSIPIEAPPSPGDSDNESLTKSSTSDNGPKFKERFPLTYALDASNRAFSYISNGYPPSPKSKEKEDIHGSSSLSERPPSAKISLESFEGYTTGIPDPESEMIYLRDRMPGSFDFDDVPAANSELALYDFLPVSNISEKEEPSIHGQTPCYTTLDIVQPESCSFRYPSISSKMYDIEPSMHGQSPSFYPGETENYGTKSGYPINEVYESKVHVNKIQDYIYNKRREIATLYHGKQVILEEIYRPLQQYEKVISTNEDVNVSDMSMAMPVPENIDVDDFSFKIQKPEQRDKENQVLAYNEILVPAEFDEDEVEEIHSEQVETVKVKNSFFKKISLTPQQALRFYNSHSTLIDLALATNPAGAAFVIAKDINQQRLTNKEARAERAAERAANPERFIEEEKRSLTFTERLMNAPKSAVQLMNENQGYITAALEASPGGRALDAARLANTYARRGVDSYVYSSSLHNNGFKKTAEKFAWDNLKSYTDPLIPNIFIPNTSSGANTSNTSSLLPGCTTKTPNNDLDTTLSESPLMFENIEYFSSVNNDVDATVNYRTPLSRNLSSNPPEVPMSVDTSELPYEPVTDARKNSKICRATVDSIAFKKYNKGSESSVDSIIRKENSVPKIATESTFRKGDGARTNILDSNTREYEKRTNNFADPTTAKKDRGFRTITDPATMKSYTLYNQPCRRNYSETDFKKTVNFDEPNIYQNGKNKTAIYKQKKPKLHARPYSMPTMKDAMVTEDSTYKDENMNVKPKVHEIPMKDGSIYVPIEALNNASFTTYISGHLQNHKGSLQKTMGQLVHNDKMKVSGDRMKLSGKTKIKAYQFKRKSLQ